MVENRSLAVNVATIGGQYLLSMEVFAQRFYVFNALPGISTTRVLKISDP
jgi:hypothetical protein